MTYGLIYLGDTGGGCYIERNGDRLNINNMPVYISRDCHVAGYLFADNGNFYLSGAPALIRPSPYTNFYNESSQICFIMGEQCEPRQYLSEHTSLPSCIRTARRIWIFTTRWRRSTTT